MKSTIRRAKPKQPAAILAVRRLVDARIIAIPQNDDPRSRLKWKNKQNGKQFQENKFTMEEITRTQLDKYMITLFYRYNYNCETYFQAT